MKLDKFESELDAMSEKKIISIVDFRQAINVYVGLCNDLATIQDLITEEEDTECDMDIEEKKEKISYIN